MSKLTAAQLDKVDFVCPFRVLGDGTYCTDGYPCKHEPCGNAIRCRSWNDPISPGERGYCKLIEY